MPQTDRRKKLKKFSLWEFILLMINIADFLFCSLMPIQAIELTDTKSEPYPFGAVVCKITGFVTLINLYASSLFLTWMAVYRAKRLIAICQTHNHEKSKFSRHKSVRNFFKFLEFDSDKNRYLTASLIWVLAVILGSLPLFYRTIKEEGFCFNFSKVNDLYDQRDARSRTEASEQLSIGSAGPNYRCYPGVNVTGNFLESEVTPYYQCVWDFGSNHNFHWAMEFKFYSQIIDFILSFTIISYFYISAAISMMKIAKHQEKSLINKQNSEINAVALPNNKNNQETGENNQEKTSRFFKRRHSSVSSINKGTSVQNKIKRAVNDRIYEKK